MQRQSWVFNRPLVSDSGDSFWSATVLGRFSFAGEGVARNKQQFAPYPQSGRTLSHSKTQACKPLSYS
jgi:hypothetical protein